MGANIESAETILTSVTHPFLIIDTGDYSITIDSSFFPFQKAVQIEYGHKCHNVIHGLDTPCHLNGIDCSVRRVKITGQPLMVEHEHVHQDSQHRDIKVHGFPLFNEIYDHTTVTPE